MLQIVDLCSIFRQELFMNIPEVICKLVQDSLYNLCNSMNRNNEQIKATEYDKAGLIEQPQQGINHALCYLTS